MPRQFDAEVVEDVFELRNDPVHDEADDGRRDGDDRDRVDHGPLDLAFEALGLLLELGQSLENDFEGTAGLARLDHVDVEVVEGLGLLGHRFGERVARFDVFDDADQRRS